MTVQLKELKMILIRVKSIYKNKMKIHKKLNKKKWLKLKRRKVIHLRFRPLAFISRKLQNQLEN